MGSISFGSFIANLEPALKSRIFEIAVLKIFDILCIISTFICLQKIRRVREGARKLWRKSSDADTLATGINVGS